MIELTAPPQLRTPSGLVKTSYLVGEQADMLHRASDDAWLRGASRNFEAFVAERVGVRERWGVPSEVLWFTCDEYYLGTLVIRHRLTEDEGGGHVGFHVVYPRQRQGHATQMLRQAMARVGTLGIQRALLTVAPGNAASLTVVKRNGGVADGINHEGELRFWLDTTSVS